MIDFTKKIKFSDKFRQPALTYIRTGQYCQYPKGTSEYMSYWTTEQDRCINGYTADDGDFISGYNYFYLNYCPILRIVNKEINGKVKSTSEVTFPDFWDYDYYYFQTIEEAQEQGKHLCVLKSRRRGYSYKAASMLCRNYYLIPNSSSYVYASNKQYLTDDGVLTKSWNYMDFIDEHTAWGKKRTVNTQLRRRAGMWVKDEYGNQIEVGYKSEIIGVTLKDNPDIVRGKRSNLIMFEEAGSFKELSAAWQIARPSVEIDGRAFGLMVAYGTGGDEDSNFFTLKDMFYHPEGYNCLPLPNIWDENVANTECGFFVPQYTNLDVRDSNGKRLYMDDDGNTLISPAKQYILEERRKVIEHSTSSIAVDRYVAERPITPSEACLEFNGNIFPKKELQEQLGKIRTNKLLQNRKQIGDLIWESNGSLKWLMKKTGDITHYPLNKNDDPTGSIVIWEHPVKDPPVGLYIMGCLTPGEKVLTDKGLINVENVSLTNKLISKDGKLVNIHNLQRYYVENENTFKFKVSNTYRTTTFTKEHPIYISQNTRRGNGTISEDLFDFNFVRAQNVNTGDWIKVPNIYNNYRDCSVEEFIGDSNFWFFVGTWLGDGRCEKNGRIYVVFNKSEIDFYEQYKKIVYELFGKSFYCRVRDNTIECSFVYKELADYLTNNFGKYANGKYLPEWSKYNSWNKKVQLIAGYLNSDGCITKDKRGYYSMEFVSVSLELLEAIQDIMFSLGYIGNLTKLRDAKKAIINSKDSYQRETFHLRFGHNDTIEFIKDTLDELENFSTKLDKVNLQDYKITRRRAKNGCFLSQDKQYIYFQIKDITSNIYTGIVYNFECDTHTFMCHHITTHNCDPYDHDQSGTNSLGSVFVYKRFQNFENYYDLIVAEYTGRPSTAEEFYENVRKLAIYYNARIMYENQNKGLFPYFVAKHCDYLLADQPDILNDIIGNSKVNRKKGCHMNKQIKQWGEGLIKDWLNDEKAPGHKNLHDILSEPLLEELISYNDLGNFDRVMALIQVMIYREQLYNVVVKEKKKQNKSRLLFDGPIFNEDSWYDDTMNNVEEDVYTFN